MAREVCIAVLPYVRLDVIQAQNSVQNREQLIDGGNQGPRQLGQVTEHCTQSSTKSKALDNT